MNDMDALLEQLRDVHSPQVGILPAPGWWALLALVLLFIIVAVWFQRRSRRRLWQKQAQAELDALRADISREPASRILARCSELARRLLLLSEPRADVAALQGDAWLAQLDQACRQPLFSQGFGRLLLDQQYRRDPQVSEADLASLMDSLETLSKAVQPDASRKLRSVHAR